MLRGAPYSRCLIVGECQNIAEHIPELHEFVAADGPMDGCWHESFRIFARENLAGNTFDIEKLKQVLDAKQQGYQKTINVINYLVSHHRDHLLAEASFRTLTEKLLLKELNSERFC